MIVIGIAVIGVLYNIGSSKDNDDNAYQTDYSYTIQSQQKQVDGVAQDSGGVEEYDMGDYIIPNSDTVIITKTDIQYLSLQEINYAKNEIYARHGRKFKSNELNNYFGSKSWYNGYISPEDFSESVLSQIEKDNIRFLSDAEFSMDPNGYQLER